MSQAFLKRLSPLCLAAVLAGNAFPAVAQTAAEYEVRISQLEQILRELTNQNETLTYNLNQLTERVDRMSRDIDLRLSDLEGGGGQGTASTVAPDTSSSNASAPSSSAGAPVPLGTSSTITSPNVRSVAPTASGTPQEQYQHAFSFINQGDYAAAEEGMRAFLQAHPKDPLAGNAQYWLGETYYVRGQYEQASKEFLAGYQSYPKSSKAPDSLLKLGISLKNLGRSKEACAAFGQLNSQYSSMPEAIRGRMNTERQGLGCN